MFDVLVQYYSLTGDDEYNDIVSQALLFQQGETGDYMPRNQTRYMGNDDQSTWALAALSAAEAKFPGESKPTWLDLAVAVFESQVQRWDDTVCGGGLRWQIFIFNNGYNYKNAISNGQFFQLASRLAHYTGNTTFSDWATKSYDWTKKVGLIDDDWSVYEGTDTGDECDAINHNQVTYVAGTYITGAAAMYNITTGDAQKTWKVVLDGLLGKSLEVFFRDGIATEACESSGRCNVDQRGFKGLLAHQLVDAVKVAPYISETIRPLLISSAKAAANSCDATGDNCVLSWNATAVRSNSTGVGEQYNALSYVQALLFWDPEASASTGNATSPTASGTEGPSATGSGSTASVTPTGSGSVLGAGNAVVALGGVLALMLAL